MDRSGGDGVGDRSDRTGRGAGLAARRCGRSGRGSRRRRRRGVRPRPGPGQCRRRRRLPRAPGARWQVRRCRVLGRGRRHGRADGSGRRRTRCRPRVRRRRGRHGSQASAARGVHRSRRPGTAGRFGRIADGLVGQCPRSARAQLEDDAGRRALLRPGRQGRTARPPRPRLHDVELRCLRLARPQRPALQVDPVLHRPAPGHGLWRVLRQHRAQQLRLRQGVGGTISRSAPKAARSTTTSSPGRSQRV